MDEKQKVIIKWLENEVKGKSWSVYFESYKYRKLAVYGAGDLGKMLIWALRNSEITLTCVIDRRANEIRKFESYDVYTLNEFLETDMDADAIVVTALSAYKEVLLTVAQKKIELPVMFLRDMVYEL